MFPVLGDDQSSYYLSEIGKLIWDVDLRRIDINLEITLLSRYIAQTRRVHLDQYFHILSYLKSHGRSKIFVDPHNNYFDSEFVDHDWKYFYGKVEDEIPDNEPESRGSLVSMTQFLNPDHAGEKMTRSSHSGIIIYLNRDPIIGYSNKYNPVHV